jgi:hypothetical protein
VFPDLPSQTRIAPMQMDHGKKTSCAASQFRARIIPAPDKIAKYTFMFVHLIII